MNVAASMDRAARTVLGSGATNSAIAAIMGESRTGWHDYIAGRNKPSLHKVSRWLDNWNQHHTRLRVELDGLFVRVFILWDDRDNEREGI